MEMLLAPLHMVYTFRDLFILRDFSVSKKRGPFFQIAIIPV